MCIHQNIKKQTDQMWKIIKASIQSEIENAD